MLPAALVEKRLHTTAARDGRLLAHVGARRRDERKHRRAGPLRQRPRRALHRLRPGRGVRRGGGRRRDAVRAARGRRALRGGDAAEPDRRHRRRRHAACRASRRVSTSWGWPGRAMPARSPKLPPRSSLAGELSIIGALAAGTVHARAPDASRAAPLAAASRMNALDRVSARAVSRSPAHGPLVAAFSASAVCFSSLVRGRIAAPVARRLCWSPS